jgi:endogenous inhibitor of DNA gyrase (YacG/DUF329 family)
MDYFLISKCPTCGKSGKHWVLGWLYCFVKMQCSTCGENFFLDLGFPGQWWKEE